MQFLFIESNEKPMWLVCQETIAVLKEDNFKRHYQSRHEANYNSSRGQELEDKIKQLTKRCTGNKLLSQNLEGLIIVFKQVSLLLKTLLKNMKSFSDGDFKKDCILHAAQCVSPESVYDCKRISL